MNALLNPDIGYILIVVGFGLTIFAILAPGTGIFEIAGVVVWLFVGWQIYNSPINIWALIILIFSIIPFVFAVRNVRKNISLGITIGSYIIGSVYLFAGDNWWQPAVNIPMAIIVSIISGGVLWLVSDKVIESQTALPSHNLGGLIGAIGEARTDIQEEGSVYVGGEMWTAYSEKSIKAGSEVKILEREGFVLKVEKE